MLPILRAYGSSLISNTLFIMERTFIHIVTISATLTIVHPVSGQQEDSAREGDLQSTYNIIVASRTIFAKLVQKNEIWKANVLTRR